MKMSEQSNGIAKNAVYGIMSEKTIDDKVAFICSSCVAIKLGGEYVKTDKSTIQIIEEWLEKRGYQIHHVYCPTCYENGGAG